MKRREFIATAAALPAAAVLPNVTEKIEKPEAIKKLSPVAWGKMKSTYEHRIDYPNGYIKILEAGYYYVPRKSALRKTQREICIDGTWFPWSDFNLVPSRCGRPATKQGGIATVGDAVVEKERVCSYEYWGKIYVTSEILYRGSDGKVFGKRLEWTQLPETVEEMLTKEML
jgi:hypothetical protein